MSKNNLVGIHEETAYKAIRRLMGNVQFLDENDLKVIEFMSKKGFYEKQKVKLVLNGK